MSAPFFPRRFVGPKTENHFNDAFWGDLDGICNALDNMEV